jgi:protein-disulfide isomerase
VKKISKKVTIEFSKMTVAMLGIGIVFGFLIGALFSGGISLPSGSTTVTTGGQQTSGSLQLTVGDNPTLGSSDAEIQMYEFSDFQCPFCRSFYTQTMDQVISDYVNTGKVQFVYKDFPLDSIHPAANIAAQYSRCANEQGMWEQMHDKIFDEQNKLGSGTIDFDQDDLRVWSADIAGLDTAALETCVSSGKYQSSIQSDFQLGINAGVTGTPTFLIGNDDKGYVAVVGAQPYSVIKEAIDQQLA